MCTDASHPRLAKVCVVEKEMMSREEQYGELPQNSRRKGQYSKREVSQQQQQQEENKQCREAKILGLLPVMERYTGRSIPVR